MWPFPTLTKVYKPNTQQQHAYIRMLANFPRICMRWRYLAKLKGSDYWATIPMTDRIVIDEGTPALTAKTPEDKIQRKEAILRRNFCVYVQKMHQDKNGPFLTEYQVLWTFGEY